MVIDEIATARQYVVCVWLFDILELLLWRLVTFHHVFASIISVEYGIFREYSREWRRKAVAGALAKVGDTVDVH